MNSLLLQKLPSLISQTLKHRRFNPHSLLSRPVSTIHASEQDFQSPSPTNAAAVKSICDSLRLGSNWDALSAKFGSLEVNEALVDQVLLELKRPGDARRALGFFHWSAQRKGLVHGVRSYSIAIHVLVGARMNTDAKALIESVLMRSNESELELSVVDSLMASFWVSGSDPFVFDLLVQSYSKLRMFRSGFEVCRYLKENGFCPSLSSFNGLLSVVEKSGDQSRDLAWEIYELMIRSRVYPNQATVKILIGCLCKEGKLRRNVDILDRICGERRSSPNLIVNTSLILGVLERGEVEEGMELLKRMLTKNMVFDTVAYSLVVYAKIKLGDLEAARDVFDEMLKRGFRPNSFVYTAFIGASCLEGKVDEAGSLVDEMMRLGLKPYGETLSFLVEGYARAGRFSDSLRSCERMFEMGLLPSLSSFNEMVKGLCGDGDAEKADLALTVVLERGFSPDEAAYEALIDGYGKIGRSNEAIKLFYEMEAKSFSPGPSGVSTFVESLCRTGELEAAERYLGENSVVAMDHLKSLYETLIASFVEKGDTEKADRLRNKIALLES